MVSHPMDTILEQVTPEPDVVPQISSPTSSFSQAPPPPVPPIPGRQHTCLASLLVGVLKATKRGHAKPRFHFQTCSLVKVTTEQKLFITKANKEHLGLLVIQ